MDRFLEKTKELRTMLGNSISHRAEYTDYKVMGWQCKGWMKVYGLSENEVNMFLEWTNNIINDSKNFKILRKFNASDDDKTVYAVFYIGKVPGSFYEG
jgi:hypothetical protein